MDFLPRNLITGSLFAALCLISVPAFAVLDTPNYSWRLGQSGNVYKVYDPQGPHLSNNFTPNSSFAENSADNGVIEYLSPGPLTIDGSTGEILNGVSLSRGLTVGDLLDSLGSLVSTDNPIGLAVLSASVLAPLLLDAWNNSQSSSSSPDSCGSSVYYAVYSNISNSFTSGPFSSPPTSGYCGSYPDGDCSVNSFSDGTGPFSSVCPSSGVYTPPSPPSNLPDWAMNNWPVASPAINTALSNSASNQIDLADSLANNNSPLSTPTPYGYSIPSPDSTVTGSPTTTSSTDPSTGQTTNTTSTPSYKFTTPTPPNGVQVTKDTIIVTQTCTSAGSCSTTNTTTNTSPAQQPKLGSFIPPAVSAPTSSAVTPTPFALDFKLPSQSVASCPQPLTFTVFSNSFNIPLTPLCTLAVDVRPYLEALGAVGAGVVIFR